MLKRLTGSARRIAPLAAGLALLGLAIPANAAQIDYRFSVQGCTVDLNQPYCGGTIGGTSFAFLTSQTMTFDYVADTSNIVSWSAGGTYGEELLGGTATFALTDASGNVLQQGAFAQSDGLFVSVDNGNSSIGLGSAGVLPTDPGFPGNVANPLGFFFMSGMDTYDLSTAAGPISGRGSICGTFDPSTGSCTIGTGDLQLTDGRSFYYYALFAAPPGTFSATEVVSSVPEPATLALLGLGLAGIGLLRRRRLAGS